LHERCESVRAGFPRTRAVQIARRRAPARIVRFLKINGFPQGRYLRRLGRLPVRLLARMEAVREKGERAVSASCEHATSTATLNDRAALSRHQSKRYGETSVPFLARPDRQLRCRDRDIRRLRRRACPVTPATLGWGRCVGVRHGEIFRGDRPNATFRPRLPPRRCGATNIRGDPMNAVLSPAPLS
jgi:hypothetical protein